jgi:DUF2075 family protein
MTLSEIVSVDFNSNSVRQWVPTHARSSNWPVVYVLDTPGAAGSTGEVYVGETLSASNRLRQHLDSPQKKHLRTARVVIDERFNKSVCLDLESYLIRMLAGDGQFQVLNRNDGIVEANYFDRATYQESFREIFERLRADGVFIRTIPEIENSDLFKLSPFKALTPDQAIAVEDILEGLFTDIRAGVGNTIVVQGEPGTGKTVIAIFLLKLLRDIAESVPGEEPDADSMFAEFFVEGYPEVAAGLRVGLVVPQQSLRKSIQKVFRRTPGLSAGMVLTPFEVGEAGHHFDVLVVDETHRLNHRANQPSGPQNKKFADITTSLFGFDDLTKTQLDWIRAKSTHQVFLADAAQAVRPADLPASTLGALVSEASTAGRLYRLQSQLRVKAGSDYIGYVRAVLSPDPLLAPAEPRTFGEYDLRLFDDFAAMRTEIRARDSELGLSRLVAGYAWKWKSKDDPLGWDIELDGIRMPWNRSQTDWIASPTSLDEIGSIHTVQGYDLNYAGVIIGNDLRFDPATGRLIVDRSSYFDKKGMENNPKLGIVNTDDDLLRFITNIYAVLLTRGIHGTYVYVCDPPLREYVRRFLPRNSLWAESSAPTASGEQI